MADRTPVDREPEIVLGDPTHCSWLEDLGAPERVERVRRLAVEGEEIRAHLARWADSAQQAMEEFEGLVSGRGLSAASHESFARLAGVDQLHQLVEEMSAILEELTQQ